MRKIIPSLLVASQLALGTFTAPPASAMLAKGWGEEGALNFQNYPLVAGLICLAILPFCLMNAKNHHPGVLTPGELREQGYSPREITLIAYDQSQIVRRLKQRRKKFAPEPRETYSSLRIHLTEIYPHVSDAYLKFFADESGAY